MVPATFMRRVSNQPTEVKLDLFQNFEEDKNHNESQLAGGTGPGDITNGSVNRTKR